MPCEHDWLMSKLSSLLTGQCFEVSWEVLDSYEYAARVGLGRKLGLYATPPDIEASWEDPISNSDLTRTIYDYVCPQCEAVLSFGRSLDYRDGCVHYCTACEYSYVDSGSYFQ